MTTTRRLRRHLFGADRPPGSAVAVGLGGVALSGLAWIAIVDVLSEATALGQTAGLLVWFGVPIAIVLLAARWSTYAGHGVALGWAAGAAFVFGSTLAFWDPTVAAVENVAMSVALSAVFATLFALVGGAVGLTLRSRQHAR